jgi:penicillin amidase
MKQLIAKQIVNEKSLWWDNIETKTEGIRTEILSKSFKTIAALETQLGKSVPAWTWNKVHVCGMSIRLEKWLCLGKYLM